MASFDIFVRRTHLVAVLLLLLLTTSGLAQENQVKIPFLFSDDEKLDQTEMTNAIPRSNELQVNPYLNAPMTRLEYMLTRLEANLNSEQFRGAVHSWISDAFESPESPSSISIDGFARYTRESGHIVAGYTIRNLGQPKRPMRTTCDHILSVGLTIAAPQQNIGYLLHHAVLGVLTQEDSSTYTPIMKTLARNIVHRVNLTSTTAGGNVMYGLTCQRTKEGAPIQYNRFSAKLR